MYWRLPGTRSFQNRVESGRLHCPSLWRCYANTSTSSDGKRVHDGCLSMYLDNARAKCAELPEGHAAVWNSMIRAHVQHGRAKEAVDLLEQMQQNSVMPDKDTFVNLLCVCKSQAALAQGKKLHTRILGTRFGADVVVGTALLSMYGKCGSLKGARSIFEGMTVRDAISWNAMMAVSANFGQGKDVLRLFEQMQWEAVMPDNVTFISIVSACAGSAALVEGKKLHARIVASGLNSDIVVKTALISMYGKAGSWEDAWTIFERMRERDVVTWNVAIEAYALHDQGARALALFHQMHGEAIMPDKVTFLNTLSVCASSTSPQGGKQMHACILGCPFRLDLKLRNTLVNMYGKCNYVDEAWKIFVAMSERDVFSWNAMIAAYAQGEQTKDALQLFNQMQQEGMMPNNVTFVSILSACSTRVDLMEGKRMHAYITGSGFGSDLVVGTALVNMYNKCGSLEEAQLVFDQMKEKDRVSWTAMIAACAQHGQGKNALLLFDQMKREGFRPNNVTFLTILSACCHAGLVDEGFRFFVLMNQEHGISPATKHYNCIVDLLGRAGRLDEAEEIIQNMTFHPTTVSWTTLLGACKSQDDVGRGVRAAGHLFKADSHDAVSYVMLSNLYAAAATVG